MVTLPRPIVYGCSALLLMSWLVVFALWRAAPAGGPAPQPHNASPYDQYLHRCRPGPWGELQYTRIVIEPPDEFLSGDYAVPAPLRWVFVGFNREMLLQLWSSAGLTEAQRHELEDPAGWETTDRGITVKPTPALILSLSSTARSAIYSVLSLFAENPNQQEPFRFRAETADEWFENSGLAPETIALIKPLLYRRGSSLLFSDHDVVLPRLASRNERLQVVKTLARKSTLLVELRVTPDADVDALTRYWGGGPRRKDIHALLQSISHRPRGSAIDIAHLLPRFARSHLFTYAEATDHPGDANYDCHWTSLNFFNDPADPRFADPAVVKQTLQTEYHEVTGPRTLGDVLVFFRADGSAIHSCVYVADEIVFTKNGASQVMPWILMTLPDVIAYYPTDWPLRIGTYRRN